MKVSEVQIIPTKPKDGLVAFASCVLNDSYYVSSIAVFSKLAGGYRLVYPTKKVGDRHLDIHHPITREMACAIEEAILSRVEQIFSP